MNATVISLPKATKTPAKAARRVTRIGKAIRRQQLAASAIGVVAVSLTGLSLTHLAEGIVEFTHCPSWQGYSMAVAIDVGFIVMELSSLVIGDKLRRALSHIIHRTIIGTLAGSAIMNAWAFASLADNPVMASIGVVLGVAIPALIWSFMRVASAMYIDAHSRG